MTTTVLFHRSPSPVGEIVVRAGGMFDGVFCLVSEDWAGEDGFVIELADEEICTREDLAYRVDYEAALATIRVETRADAERVYDLVLEDDFGSITDEDVAALRADDTAHAMWEIQRIRGRIAKAAGYSAVVCSDEHGTSYLVMSGTLGRVSL